MRRTRWLLLAAPTLALPFVLGGTAHAQEEDVERLLEEFDESVIVEAAEDIAIEHGGDEFTAECIEILAEGGSIDNCQEAPNPLLPELNEIIWGTIGFAVVFFFLVKFGLPPIRKSMAARAERIRNDLQSAESKHEEAEQLLAEYRAQLNEARNEAGRIIEEARQAADQLKSERETSLQAELDELRTRASSEIDSAKAQAMIDLRDEVAQLAIGAAEAVVQRNLDAETQTQLVEDYINQVATQSS